MAERNDESHPKSQLSRRQVIRRGMVAGGVALWSAPVVAAAALNRDEVRQRILERLGQAGSSAGAGADTAALPAVGPVVVQQQTSGCTSYPVGTCIEFICGGPHTVCGDGAGGFDCFCDTDATAACVCRNDAFCSDLALCSTANGNADCPPGYFCIPTSCCAEPRCAPPCGTLPAGARPASPLSQFLPILNGILPNGATVSGL